MTKVKEIDTKPRYQPYGRDSTTTTSSSSNTKRAILATSTPVTTDQIINQKLVLENLCQESTIVSMPSNEVIDHDATLVSGLNTSSCLTIITQNLLANNNNNNQQQHISTKRATLPTVKPPPVFNQPKQLKNMLPNTACNCSVVKTNGKDERMGQQQALSAAVAASKSVNNKFGVFLDFNQNMVVNGDQIDTVASNKDEKQVKQPLPTASTIATSTAKQPNHVNNNQQSTILSNTACNCSSASSIINKMMSNGMIPILFVPQNAIEPLMQALKLTNHHHHHHHHQEQQQNVIQPQMLTRPMNTTPIHYQEPQQRQQQDAKPAKQDEKNKRKKVFINETCLDFGAAVHLMESQKLSFKINNPSDRPCEVKVLSMRKPFDCNLSVLVLKPMSCTIIPIEFKPQCVGIHYNKVRVLVDSIELPLNVRLYGECKA